MLKKIVYSLVCMGLICGNTQSFAQVGTPARGFAQTAQRVRMTPREAIYHYAKTGNVKGLESLKAQGYKIDLSDAKGNSSLCEAVWRGDRTAVASLMKAGASTSNSCMKKIPENYKNAVGLKRVAPQVATASTAETAAGTATAAGATGLSTGAMVGIGVGAAALIGGGVAIAAGGGGGGGSHSVPCSGHGTQDESGACTCNAGYSGTNCEICADGYGKHGTNECHLTKACEHGSQQGENCVCQTGYAGELCNACASGYDKHGTNECHATKACVHGEQQGANCVCQTGYAGELCDTCAAGYGLHGTSECHLTLGCVGGNQQGDACICDTGYTGELCETCADGYGKYGTNECYPTKACVNGSQQGANCQCTTIGWTGDLCDTAAACTGYEYTTCPEGYAQSATCLSGDTTKLQCNNCAAGYGKHGTEQCYADISCGENQHQQAAECVCDAGYTMQGGVCVFTSCPANQYKSGDSCNACPANSTSPAGSTSINQCVCNNGYTKTATNICVQNQDNVAGNGYVYKLGVDTGYKVYNNNEDITYTENQTESTNIFTVFSDGTLINNAELTYNDERENPENGDNPFAVAVVKGTFINNGNISVSVPENRDRWTATGEAVDVALQGDVVNYGNITADGYAIYSGYYAGKPAGSVINYGKLESDETDISAPGAALYAHGLVKNYGYIKGNVKIEPVSVEDSFENAGTIDGELYATLDKDYFSDEIPSFILKNDENAKIDSVWLELYRANVTFENKGKITTAPSYDKEAFRITYDNTGSSDISKTISISNEGEMYSFSFIEDLIPKNAKTYTNFHNKQNGLINKNVIFDINNIYRTGTGVYYSDAITITNDGQIGEIVDASSKKFAISISEGTSYYGSISITNNGTINNEVSLSNESSGKITFLNTSSGVINSYKSSTSDAIVSISNSGSGSVVFENYGNINNGIIYASGTGASVYNAGTMTVDGDAKEGTAATYCATHDCYSFALASWWVDMGDYYYDAWDKVAISKENISETGDGVYKTLTGAGTKDDPYVFSDYYGKSKYIKLADGATLATSGTLSSTSVLNLAGFSPDGTGSVTLMPNGNLQAQSIVGDLHIDTSNVTNGFNTTYTAQNAIQAENTTALNLISDSALFNASLADNGKDVVMQMKSFDEVTNNKSLAQFLANNYALGNNENFFNEIKSLGSASSFTKTMNQLTGRDTIGQFAFEDLSAMREINLAMNEQMFANDDKALFGTQGSMNGFSFKNDNHSTAQYALAQRRITPRVKLGYAMSSTVLNTDDDDDTTRSNQIFQVFMPVSYNRAGWKMIATPQIGYARGHYTRSGFNDASYKGTIEKRIFALMNEARYPLTVAGITLEPTVEFNAIAYNQRGSEDKKEYSLTMPSDNNLSVEGGMGFYAKHESGRLKLNAGLMMYREFADPYNIKLGMNGMSGSFDLYDENRSEYRGVASFGFDYGLGAVDLYGNIHHYMETDTHTTVKTGLKLGF